MTTPMAILLFAALGMPRLPPDADMNGISLTIDPSAVAWTSGLEIALGPVTKDRASPFFGEDKPWDVAW